MEPLINRVRDIFFSDLRSLVINGFRTYACENREMIDFLYNNGAVKDYSIDKEVEKAVIGQAKRDYNNIVIVNKAKVFLDNAVISPGCLVYAWQKGEITDEDFSKVPIDLDYAIDITTIGDRYKTHSLISDIRQIILTERFGSNNKDIVPGSCESYHCHHD